MRKHNVISSFLGCAITVVLVLSIQARVAGQVKASASHGVHLPQSVRLYVFDCGTLHITNTEPFRLKREEVGTTEMSVPCFLVAHPRGTLIWETGVVPDTDWSPVGHSVVQHVVLPDSQEIDVTLHNSLRAQLAEAGYSPSDITYLALSHYHFDHTANANAFAASTWLVREVERDGMFAEKPPGLTQPSTYSALRKSKTIILKANEYDVFGDGTAIIKLAPGHTPGHQVLYLKLAKTGGVVLSGDLYHYPEERVLDRVPTFEFNAEQTRASRVALDAFLKKTGARLWIQHDFTADAKLKKSPNFYE